MESVNTHSNLIKPIDRNVVHQICSGQVILSLAVAVKELVENSIDAGANIIDITLKEYGSDLIEVSDNGNGVIEDNFQALTLKHYTSKIQDFSDLQNLETLGFRGEALSSLCALADLTILTKHSTSEQANRIKYNTDGKITTICLAARQTGTTVILENLFTALPVRRKEFLKNLKREFNKMCQLMYAYCLVSKGIKFTCTNITNKGNKNVVVATQGLNKVRENIISVFGSKQISTLIDVQLVKPEQSIQDEYNIKLGPDEEIPFEIEFLISSVSHGDGRSSTDRQFFYVNSRPVEPTKIIKLVNQIYKQFNGNQYPFVFLNIFLKDSIVDINVTPDKRQIFIEKENIFLATIKASLLDSFKLFPSKVPIENHDISCFLSSASFSNERKGIKRSHTDSPIKSKNILDTFRKKSKSDSDVKLNKKTKNSNNEEDTVSESKLTLKHQLSLLDYAKNNILKQRYESSDQNLLEKTILFESQECKLKKENKDTKATEIADLCSDSNRDELNISTQEIMEEAFGNKNKDINKTILEHTIVEEYCENDFSLSLDEEAKVKEIKHENKLNKNENSLKNKSMVTPHEDNVTIILDSPQKNPKNRRTLNFDISIESIRERMKKKCLEDENNENIKVKFRSTITPENNKTAEAELQKQLSKQDFSNMNIVGQFNLGFIIAKLRNDLFIIDQHATDEKYNFEHLQATTILQKQILVNPKPLELTAGNESILIENEEIFKKNGFQFKIDENAPSTKKITLTAVPVSHSIVFGKDDIDEMLFMLKDSSHTMCRPSRVRAMLASRACRKSVMIGKSLSNKDMKQLIDHMGEIDQPWNCPHGRPTIRHLINLDLLVNTDDEH